MIKYSPFLLILTLPYLSGEPYFGVPMWVWGSLAATLLYAIVLIIAIESKWSFFKESDDD